jgi:hypothetical protein
MKHHLGRYAHAVDFTTQPAEYFAYHDLLTGLPNRAAFSAHLTRTVEAASATATSFAVVPKRATDGSFAIWLSSLTKYTANPVKTPAQNLLHRLKSGPVTLERVSNES